MKRWVFSLLVLAATAVHAVGKGYTNLAQRQLLVRELINRFNVMRQSLANVPDFSHVKYIDLRGRIGQVSGALLVRLGQRVAPDGEGFAAVAAQFSAAL